LSLSVDYSVTPFLITIPKSDLTLESGTRYKLTVDEFWILLRDFSDNEGTMAQPKLYRRIAATSSTPSITEIEEAYYSLQFEDGLYSVNIVNGNTNIREVEDKNQVSVSTNNTTGFIDPEFLEAGLFGGGVAIKPSSPYTISSSVAGVVGTREHPVNNMADAHVIAAARGLNNIYVMEDLTIAGVDISGQSYHFVGDSTFTTLTASPSANILGSSMALLTIDGEMDGINIIRDSIVVDVTRVSGSLENTALASTAVLSGPTVLLSCYSQVVGSLYPEIEVGSWSLQVRSWHGSLGIKGVTGGTHTIEMYGGQLHVDETSTGGTIHVRGNYSKPPNDLSAGAVTIIDETEVSSNWTHALTESYPTDGASSTTPAQLMYAINQMLSEFSRSGTTISIKKRDGTEAFQLELDSATAPTISHQST